MPLTQVGGIFAMLSKKSILCGIKRQLKKHPDCINTIRKWKSYKDRPFSVSLVYKCKVSFKKVRTMLGFSNYGYKYEDLNDAIDIHLKKHPECMESEEKWNGYSDKPFCSEVICGSIGWRKAKEDRGLRCPKQEYSKADIYVGVKKQIGKHPNCLNSKSEWNSHKDKPFCLSTIDKNVGWRKLKKKYGVNIGHKYSDREILNGIRTMVRKHPDCMKSGEKSWKKYKDRPFGFCVIERYGYRRAKKDVGLECPIKGEVIFDETRILKGVSLQLKRHPDCMLSFSKWSSYDDRPFSYGTINKIGWDKCKILNGQPVGFLSSMLAIMPLFAKHRNDSEWMSDVFSMVTFGVIRKRHHNYRFRLDRKLQELLKLNKKFTKEDYNIAKKCLSNLRDEWHRNHTCRKAA